MSAKGHKRTWREQDLNVRSGSEVDIGIHLPLMSASGHF